MTIFDTLNLSIDIIRLNKLRSFLTILGMIIGVLSFMVILSVLQGFNSYIDEKLSKIGSSAFTIKRFSSEDLKNSDTFALAQRRNKELTFDELDFIKEKSQFIYGIGAKSNSILIDLKYKNLTLNDITISGTESVIAEIENIEVAEGRYFTEAENSNSIRVAFIGYEIANRLFPTESALNKDIYIRGIPYKVIGVRTIQGDIFGQSQDLFIQIPLKTFGSNFGGLKNLRGLQFIVGAKEDVSFTLVIEMV